MLERAQVRVVVALDLLAVPQTQAAGWGYQRTYRVRRSQRKLGEKVEQVLVVDCGRQVQAPDWRQPAAWLTMARGWAWVAPAAGSWA